jgi:hypothetical protein
MSNTTAYFDVQYQPAGQPARKFLRPFYPGGAKTLSAPPSLTPLLPGNFSLQFHLASRLRSSYAFVYVN